VPEAGPRRDPDLVRDHADRGLGVATFGEQAQRGSLDRLLERDRLRLAPGWPILRQLRAPIAKGVTTCWFDHCLGTRLGDTRLPRYQRRRRRLVRIKAGHNIQEQQPVALAASIRRFLTGPKA
jgi:pimeloyl-ACP methyl ester carboxylesterase